VASRTATEKATLSALQTPVWLAKIG